GRALRVLLSLGAAFLRPLRRKAQSHPLPRHARSRRLRPPVETDGRDAARRPFDHRLLALAALRPERTDPCGKNTVRGAVRRRLPFDPAGPRSVRGSCLSVALAAWRRAALLRR